MEVLPNEQLAALRIWRQAHPTATWSEVEAEIDRQLKRVHAAWMTELAVPLAGDEQVTPLCPDCQAVMRRCGERERHVQSQRGPMITVRRPYYLCPVCHTGLFPPG